jgi:signal transduction histidine kinase
MAKRSINFRGRPGRHLNPSSIVATMKALGKTDDEIIEAVKELQRIADDCNRAQQQPK